MKHHWSLSPRLALHVFSPLHVYVCVHVGTQVLHFQKKWRGQQNNEFLEEPAAKAKLNQVN